jgi:hypothetical protein
MHDMLGVWHSIIYLIDTLIHLRYILLNVICKIVMYFTLLFCEERPTATYPVLPTLSTLIENLNSFHLCLKLLILSALVRKVRTAGNYFERNGKSSSVDSLFICSNWIFATYFNALIFINTRTYILSLWTSLKDWVNLIVRFTKPVIKNVSLSIEMSPTKRIINHKYNTHIKSRI